MMNNQTLEHARIVGLNDGLAGLSEEDTDFFVGENKDVQYCYCAGFHRGTKQYADRLEQRHGRRTYDEVMELGPGSYED